jgi:hypothetical protein
MKALVIADPWIDLILKGEKTWEMRKRPWNFRGSVALIRKGSGQVLGIAIVIECRPALHDLAAYAAAEHLHCIPPAMQPETFDKGWRTPWVLAHARCLARPVPYRHRKGAMSVFDLDESVAAQVRADAP